jgi:hypothetical protein
MNRNCLLSNQWSSERILAILRAKNNLPALTLGKSFNSLPLILSLALSLSIMLFLLLPSSLVLSQAQILSQAALQHQVFLSQGLQQEFTVLETAAL